MQSRRGAVQKVVLLVWLRLRLRLSAAVIHVRVPPAAGLQRARACGRVLVVRRPMGFPLGRTWPVCIMLPPPWRAVWGALIRLAASRGGGACAKAVCGVVRQTHAGAACAACVARHTSSSGAMQYIEVSASSSRGAGRQAAATAGGGRARGQEPHLRRITRRTRCDLQRGGRPHTGSQGVHLRVGAAPHLNSLPPSSQSQSVDAQHAPDACAQQQQHHHRLQWQGQGRAGHCRAPCPALPAPQPWRA